MASAELRSTSAQLKRLNKTHWVFVKTITILMLKGLAVRDAPAIIKHEDGQVHFQAISNSLFTQLLDDTLMFLGQTHRACCNIHLPAQANTKLI
jgi:hypothetical protein